MPMLKPLIALVLTLPAHMLLLTACSTESPRSLPPGIKPAKVIRLEDSGRVSKVPTPPICSPTCNAGLTTLRDSLLATPTPSALPASAAKPTPTAR